MDRLDNEENQDNVAKLEPQDLRENAGYRDLLACKVE